MQLTSAIQSRKWRDLVRHHPHDRISIADRAVASLLMRCQPTCLEPAGVTHRPLSDEGALSNGQTMRTRPGTVADGSR